MQLYGAFSLAKLGPGEHGKAELNNGRIEQVKFAIESETMFGGKITAALQKLMEECFIQ